MFPKELFPGCGLTLCSHLPDLLSYKHWTMEVRACPPFHSSLLKPPPVYTGCSSSLFRRGLSFAGISVAHKPLLPLSRWTRLVSSRILRGMPVAVMAVALEPHLIPSRWAGSTTSSFPRSLPSTTAFNPSKLLSQFLVASSRLQTLPACNQVSEVHSCCPAGMSKLPSLHPGDLRSWFLHSSNLRFCPFVPSILKIPVAEQTYFSPLNQILLRKPVKASLSWRLLLWQ